MPQSLDRTWAVLEHALSEALKPHGLTPTQSSALRVLRGARGEGTLPGRGDGEDNCPSAGCRSVQDAAGLIERARDAEGRRFTTTEITEEGLRVLGELDEPVLTLHRRQLAMLDKEDLQSLVELLGALGPPGRSISA